MTTYAIVTIGRYLYDNVIVVPIRGWTSCAAVVELSYANISLMGWYAHGSLPHFVIVVLTSIFFQRLASASVSCKSAQPKENFGQRIDGLLTLIASKTVICFLATLFKFRESVKPFLTSGESTWGLVTKLGPSGNTSPLFSLSSFEMERSSSWCTSDSLSFCRSTDASRQYF
jgi:hypothetical protein